VATNRRKSSGNAALVIFAPGINQRLRRLSPHFAGNGVPLGNIQETILIDPVKAIEILFGSFPTQFDIYP
jgi:hypothetical protein